MPGLAWVGLVATALAFTPLLLPERASPTPPLTQLERQAIDVAGEMLEDNRGVEGMSEALGRLRTSETVDEALAALADAESRLETQASRRTEVAAQVAELADGLQAAGPELPRDLAEQLRELRERLAGRPDTAALVTALEGIETRAGSAEALARIVAEMRHLAASEPDAMAALEQVRAQKKAIAAAALESARTGRLARLDGTPGQESDDSVAQGAPLRDTIDIVREEGTLTLDAIASGVGRERRVFSRDTSSPASSSGSLMPFEQVVLAARESAAQAANNESLPVAYRDRIRRYFGRLPASTREGTE